MKQLLITLMAMIAVSVCHGQKLKESEIPTAVKQSFQKQFPTAKSVTWEKEGENEIEAEFKNGSIEQSAEFDKDGRWLSTETEIKESELPAAVRSLIAKDFQGYKISESEKIEKANKEISYEVEVEKEKSEYEVNISADGKLISKEEKKHKEKNEKKD